jgi:ribose 5-phosphate isomerase A
VNRVIGQPTESSIQLAVGTIVEIPCLQADEDVRLLAGRQMNQNDMKKAAALEAVKYIKEGDILGVGTGSTVNFFIENLAPLKDKIKGAVSSSLASAERLKKIGIPVLDLNDVEEFDVYIDGADEINGNLEMIKGGGAALTREKIVAAVAKKFVCIVDETKLVSTLGAFPLPIEVIPMARNYVSREMIKMGGRPVYRSNVITDNGNSIIDIHDLMIKSPKDLEKRINMIPGVVTVGLFAHRGADVLIIGGHDGVKIIDGSKTGSTGIRGEMQK